FATYQQLEEFMLAEGENVVGPIQILPTAIVDAVVVKAEGITVKSIIYDKTSLNWRESLLGKEISIEGDGRIIKGVVKGIDEKYITLSTPKGLVITTLPKFPSRITANSSWEEVVSPQITLKVNSPSSKSSLFLVKYPIEGISWKVSYILEKSRNGGILKGFLIVENNTPVDFGIVELKLKSKRINRQFNNISIFPYSTKKVFFIKKNIKSPTDLKGLPEGEVFVYKNGIFVGKSSIRSVFNQ
ncbi:MAG: hypothetical protein GXO45_03025, partial [Aquificae bacterium]|nr:hypothetical protein [Aquificota bacterium]